MFGTRDEASGNEGVKRINLLRQRRSHAHGWCPLGVGLELVVEQKALGCVLASRQPLVPGHTDTMSCSASSLTDDHFEFERVSLSYAPSII
jgi:hypothetical protein